MEKKYIEPEFEVIKFVTGTIMEDSRETGGGNDPLNPNDSVVNGY